MSRRFVVALLAILVLLAGSVGLIAWSTGDASRAVAQAVTPGTPAASSQPSRAAPVAVSVVAPPASSEPNGGPQPQLVRQPFAPVPAIAPEAPAAATPQSGRVIREDPGEPAPAETPPRPLHRGKWAPDERTARLAVQARQPRTP